MTAGLLDGLNEHQREAITAGDGPVLVLAGPGSGKTRVLTHRVAYLIRERGAYPSSILAVTFTNKAAGEMRARVESLIPDVLNRNEGSHLSRNVGTFHAICARWLRREAQFTDRKSDYLIYDSDDQVALMTQVLSELNVDSKKYRPRQILNAVSSAKNELITPDRYQGEGYLGEIVRRAYVRYQEMLVAANARDFDDLLLDTALLLRDFPDVLARYQRFIDYLLVDEFQDTNAVQYALVRLLTHPPRNNVFVVGDEDQAIYGFRGADYRNVAQFKHDFPQAQVILLEQNYRSTQIVLDAARAVIDKNTHRTPKALFTDRAGGSPVMVFEAYSDTEEAEFVVKTVLDLCRREKLDYKDFAVMYRTNAQSRALEEACIREGVPYKLVGGVGFYKRKEIRDLLAYLRLVNNPDDSVSFNRVINVPKRGIGKKSLDDFNAWLAKKRLTISGALTALVNGEVSPLGSGARKFIEFTRLLERWREQAGAGDLGALLDTILADIGYTLYVHQEADTPDEAAERENNLRELRGLLADRADQPLNEFLEGIALVADVDALAEGFNALTLLTLHAAKGLEYPVVFITGLEEGLLPHFRALDEPEGMQEERRLMYVGLTRAMHHVFLSYAFRRVMYGDSSPGVPSRFLGDIPGSLIEGGSSRLGQDRSMRAYLEATTWDQVESSARSRPLPASTPSRESENRRGVRAQITPFSAPGAAPQRYRTGLRVFHSTFGEGLVVESRLSGGEEEVTVSFKTHGIKRLAASFANLVVIEE